jgi:hypothetical protein
MSKDTNNTVTSQDTKDEKPPVRTWRALPPLPEWVIDAPPSTVLNDFSHHIILYSKNWYGSSGHILVDLRVLMAEYSGQYVDTISDSQVWQSLVETLVKYVKNEFDLSEAILSMIGKNHNFKRTIEGVMIGKIATIDGCYCDPRKRLDILSFDPLEPLR